MPNRRRTTGKPKAPVESLSRERTWPVYVTVVAMLVWYFVSAVSAISSKCTTFDETLHLTAGYSSWKFGDFRMQPENGNLPQRWAAIPLLFRTTHFPNFDQPAWRKSIVGHIGDQFFYDIGNNPDAMLLGGRAMNALFGVALGAIVFFWTRSLMGTGPALLSLGLYSFCPTMLTNGALITSDMAAALFFSASMFCIWRVLHRVNWQNLVVGSLVMACLFVAKFSAPMIGPMGLLLVAIQLISRQPTVVSFGGRIWTVTGRGWRLLVHLATIAVHAAVVWIVIWAFFDFRYDMFAITKTETNQAGELVVIDQPLTSWDTVLKASGRLEPFINRMRDAHFLPEAYLYGFTQTWMAAQYRTAFLNGEYSHTGWLQFFPYCLLVKTPLTLFVLMGLAVAWIVRGWYRAGETWRVRAGAMLSSFYRTAPLWILFLVYWSFAIPSHLNIGHRHILPTYPQMLILAGGSWFWLASAATGRQRGAARVPRWLAARRWPALACLVLVSTGLFAAESLWRWPNYLAYFNQLVGGPSHGYRHLVDSSLDWGQDLPALKQWLVANKLDGSSNANTYLSYFGTGSPAYYGIKATLLPTYPWRVPTRIPGPLKAGTYCVSATMLNNLYMTVFRGPWSHHYEVGYQELVSTVREFYQANEEGRRQLLTSKGEDFWRKAFSLYEQARLARLVTFLRQREPDAQVNYSILIYRLGSEDLNRALDGPPVELEDTESAEAE